MVYQENKLRINIIIGIGVFLAILVAAFFFSQSALLDIDELKVKGNLNTPAEHIIAISGLELGNKLFPLDSDAAERSIRRLPWVKTVEVQRAWSGSVTFKVVERKPVAVAFSRHGYVLLDREGRVLEILGSEGTCESNAELFPDVLCIANLIVPNEAGSYVREVNRAIIDAAYQVQILEKCLVSENTGCPEASVSRFTSFVRQIVVHVIGEFEISLQLNGGGWILLGDPAEMLVSKAFDAITLNDESIARDLCGDATLDVRPEGRAVLTPGINC